MKREALLLVPLLLLLVLVGVVAAEIPDDVGLPTAVQIRLDQYTAPLSSLRAATVRSVARAEKPWNLVEDSSQAAFGDTLRFQVDSGLAGSLPLSYPPIELWCVLLEREEDLTGDAVAGAEHAVLLVGLHTSLYEAYWLVHEAVGDTAMDLQKVLSTVGCDLDLD
jgi:hypothetical protein